MRKDPFIIDGPCLWSFSGGRTSAYMLWRALQAYGGQLPDDHVVAFANTGAEHEETLKFVARCAESFGANVVWLEATARHNSRDSSGHRVVTFETASRNGEPFEKFVDGREAFDPELDKSGGACGEADCQIFSDDDLFPVRRSAA